MTFARLRFALVLLVFLGWLAWLAVAVAKKGETAPLSRAQFTAATHVAVIRIQIAEDGLPAPDATVTEVISGTELTPNTTITILNLPRALIAGGKQPQAEQLCLAALDYDGRTYRLAGLPRSPGNEASEPTRPVLYPWNEFTQTQLKTLGILK